MICSANRLLRMCSSWVRFSHFERIRFRGAGHLRLPRTRGDRPSDSFNARDKDTSPPHTRGSAPCSFGRFHRIASLPRTRGIGPSPIRSCLRRDPVFASPASGKRSARPLSRRSRRDRRPARFPPDFAPCLGNMGQTRRGHRWAPPHGGCW